MELVAFGFGALMSWWWLQKISLPILGIIYWFPIRSESNFESMYDKLENRNSYIVAKYQLKITTYASYLRLHRSARASSFRLFREHYDAVVNSFFTRHLPIVLMPAIFFWAQWYFYIFGAVVVFFSLLAYMIYVKQINAGHHVLSMLCTILNAYQKEEEQGKKQTKQP